MKTDLATSIVVAIVGTVAAYFVCNLLVPKIDDFTYKALDSKLQYNLSDPNIEVFNYRAVNPTVEVYVGQCSGDNCETAVSIDNEAEEEAKEETKEETETTPQETPEEQSGTNEEPENGTTD